ncbi:MAG: type II secretion system F family protein [Planctomycetes bacterium]|nr:type II secretion system F family protein [Planctomycetota bacterium]
MNGILSLAAFVAGVSFVFLIWLVIPGPKGRLEMRLASLGQREERLRDRIGLARFVHSLPFIGSTLMPADEGKQAHLRSRVVQAGLYGRQATLIFLGVKLLLMAIPVGLGLLAASSGILPLVQALLFGAFAGVAGTIAPSFWLDHLKSQRQTKLRRSLPDALDIMVICLEGGLSLPGSFDRVANELRTAHPMLASELRIVQREIQLGRSTGEALRQLAERFDVEELRSMSSVISQAEKFGASVVKALRVYADSLRQKRQQRAEEMAQKAGTKILFPTLLFIFPAIFVVLLGPALIQILDMFRNLNLPY